MAATELAPHRGDVVVFTPERRRRTRLVRQRRDLTATTTPPASRAGSPRSSTAASRRCSARTRRVTSPSTSGTDAGVNGTTWAVDGPHRDGARRPRDRRHAVGRRSRAASLAVAGVAASWGDLFEWSASSPKGAFTRDGRLAHGQRPARARSRARPPRSSSQGQLSLFAAGVSVPAPEGTGVYAMPFCEVGPGAAGRLADPRGDRRARRAVRAVDGAARPPTGVDRPRRVRGRRDPGEPPARDVAQLLDGVAARAPSPRRVRRGDGADHDAHLLPARVRSRARSSRRRSTGTASDGLSLKPDWVLFDPEGYPDNHSGLWGPTSPASKLSQSVANWYAILNGWRSGPRVGRPVAQGRALREPVRVHDLQALRPAAADVHRRCVRRDDRQGQARRRRRAPRSGRTSSGSSCTTRSPRPARRSPTSGCCSPRRRGTATTTRSRSPPSEYCPPGTELTGRIRAAPGARRGRRGRLRPWPTTRRPARAAPRRGVHDAATTTDATRDAG